MQAIRICAFVLAISPAVFAGTAFKATTTLTAETANNTSAADTFATQTNGNHGAGNVSKMPSSNLLYPGATGKIYAHLMLWFGGSNHMNVGYASGDTTQIHKQITDMVSRGIDGAIIDWYGQGANNQSFAAINQATQAVMNEAVLHPSFTFAVMDDAGSLQSCARTSGCDVTQTLINDLSYAYNNYQNSSAYLRYNGRPVVYFFGQESSTIDWSRVRTSVPGNPLFIFRNTGGFSYAQSNGAFSWVAPETAGSTDLMALNYLNNFDQTAISQWPAYSTESGYKGFNDTLAAWGTGRIITQDCGQTWFQTIAQSAKYYSTSKQMLGIQLVTWNDYEEGTEIESGIDNCVTVNAAVSGTFASWSITGESTTLDHYTVFLSQDGENLMWLADVPPTASSIDVAQFNLNAGNYQVFIKAVGQPSITNKISAAVSLMVPDVPPVIVLSVSPTSGTAPVTVNASTSGSYAPLGSIASSTINFGDGSAPVSAISATHTYSTGGTFTVTATITDNLGTASSKSVPVSIALDLPPVAELAVSATSGYGPLTITASTAGSYDPDGAAITSSINFGDGATAAGPNAGHTYTVPGSYNVAAIVTDSAGLSSTTSKLVTVKAPEVIVINPASGAITISPVQVVAAGFSGFPVNTMQIYVDGVLNYTVASGSLNAGVALAPGIHSLAVKGWDSSGRSFMQSLPITIDQPVAAITVSGKTLLIGASITASAQGSSDPYSSITATQIDFGDGTVVAAAGATHRYKIAGTFTVKATVTDALGASSAASTTVQVKPQYVVISSPAAGAITSSVQVVGTANSGYPIAATQVYLDGVVKYQTSASSVSIPLAISAGTHLIVVQGWDSSGATFKAGVTVTR